ncbi:MULTISPECIES: penicillin-binding transpeptidase domain-containing protein [Rhodococcus]|uniref:Penicillin-binding transpeptidase domain-containing protein n=3 Tax=Rhodococcus opacus TaxID=37919 RepID=A0AAX3YHK9_RHOOP|nr:MULTISPECIES: penicillin-binding transpeptidase domain-containing protein [Rhodococcus]ELB89686.1 penicillin-binding protein [Rhodococcus wratislaviensis IFP 2016]NHU44839.1 penicillin-binding protein [Rhodococcus sp. A14]EID77600.1 penicillin-binding protein [Rhodococcus opacus RKJ300 = JCM 13270]EKT77764.1 penicillin-binding protein [Rhodococcus opacus M213]MCZ4585541.1 penicillin-binding transpeptidase domain-containing protein [Rhodococcus opacus]
MIESVRTSTVRHSPIRPTPTRKAAAGIAVLATVLSACGLFGPDQPDTVSQQFADALNSDDVQAAAELTTDPAAATAAITAMYDGLGNKDGTFTRTDVQESGDDGGTFTMDVSWPFAPGQEWKYSTTGNATKEGDDWKIVWDPAVLAPGLTDDTTVRYTTTTGTPPKVLAAGGAPILEQQVVTLVNLEQGADTAAVAALLSPIAPTITAASLQQDLAGAQGKPVTAISLRAEDLAPIEPQLRQLAGVTLAPQTRLLSTDKALASPTLAGLGDLWQEGQDASAGWAVQLVGQDGAAKSIAGEQGPDAPDIATTLDLPMQMAAERALADVPQQAAIVALRPSTGEVLAVAQNAPADALGPIALTGLYPPGSTFKTVTTSAALQAGAATPDTVLPCPGTENIEGRQIPNDDEFDLGAVPLHTAFARSCNTTMGRLAVGLPPDALQQAALQFGLGVDYVTPGLTTVTGNVPVADSPAARVESGIGQGQVTATPFGMAMVAASIANGSTPSPMIVQGQPGTADKTAPTVPANVTSDLRTMMRETVTGGTATALQDIPGLLGKTGTAESGNGPAHGWFVGIKDDLAFAVFIATGDSSAPAVQAAGRFLR